MSTISCEATLGYAIDTISTRTNRICEVGCGQILRQISPKIKPRTDQSVTRKAKHSSVLGVLIIWKKKAVMANNLDTRLTNLSALLLGQSQKNHSVLLKFQMPALAIYEKMKCHPSLCISNLNTCIKEVLRIRVCHQNAFFILHSQ